MRDEHHVLPRYRHLEQERAHAQQARIQTSRALTSGTPIITAGTATNHPAGGDPWQLRGIPVVGYGIPGGASPGTRPDTARTA